MQRGIKAEIFQAQNSVTKQLFEEADQMSTGTTPEDSKKSDSNEEPRSMLRLVV